MRVVRQETAGDLLQQAMHWLLQSEAENSLLIGIAQQQMDSKKTDHAAQFWASIADDSGITGCAFRTPPYHLTLSRMPAAAIPLLLEEVTALYPDLPGVAGSIEEATLFAQSWSAQADVDWSVRVRTRVHRLTNVRFPENPPDGTLRKPLDDEVATIREWAVDFVRETKIPDTPNDFINKLLALSALYVWDDRGPRCMIAVSRESPNSASVSGVYTPPSDRQCGYASAAVATLSEKLLDKGKLFCCLYTDLANPVSNSIYQRIGYQPVRDDVIIDFAAR